MLPPPPAPDDDWTEAQFVDAARREHTRLTKEVECAAKQVRLASQEVLHRANKVHQKFEDSLREA
eukprot:728979-Pyramimonas_sp.AAC.1